MPIPWCLFDSILSRGCQDLSLYIQIQQPSQINWGRPYLVKVRPHSSSLPRKSKQARLNAFFPLPRVPGVEAKFASM